MVLANFQIGFGGTNAHAILETYEAQPPEQVVVPAFTPLVISAASKTSLRAVLSELCDFLKENLDINLRNLAYTLHTRRSTLPFRQVVAGIDIQEIISRIESILTEDGTILNTRYFGVSSPKIFGIFTGQGAQWSQMVIYLLTSLLVPY